MASFPLSDRTSAFYYAILADPAGALVGPSLLTTLTLKLYDKATGAILNGRNVQNVLNTNDVDVYDTIQTGPNGEQYNLRWTMRPLDSAVQNNTLDVETHVALFQLTWSAGAKGLNFEVILLVKNFSQVP